MSEFTEMQPVEGEEGLLVPVTEEGMATLIRSILQGEGKPMTDEAITKVIMELLYVKVEVQIRTMLARLALEGEFLIDSECRMWPSVQPSEQRTQQLPQQTLVEKQMEGEQRRCGRCKAFSLMGKCPECGWPTSQWRAA